MKFQPKTENECRNLLPEAVYDFEIHAASNKISQSSGNDMITLKLAIWEGDKVKCHIYDNILEALPAKLRHCCDACGLLDKYQQGELLAFDFEGRTGKVKIGIEKDKNGKYPDKNVVRDYVQRGGSHFGNHDAILPTSNNPPSHVDDDDPFGGL